MQTQNLIHYFLLMVTITLVGCQTNPIIEAKGETLEQTVSSPPQPQTQTQRSCWTEMSQPIKSDEQQTFILAMGANMGKLKKANDDAIQFKQAMQQYFTVPENHICLLTNVYRNEFERALKDLNRWVKPDDRVIIFFSGHGSFIKDDNGDEEDKLDDVFITMDVKHLKTPSRIDAMTDDAFVQLVNKLSTQHVITFIDACHSGGMYQGEESESTVISKFFKKGIFGELISWLDFEETQPNQPINQPIYLEHINGVVLAAAGESEKAWEDPKEGGLFTTTFLKRLKRYPQVSLRDIFENIKVNIFDIQNVKGIPPQEYQHPQIIGNMRLVE